MIWNEWLDEALAVLVMNVLLNLVFELKFLNVFVGREDPIEFYIWFVYFFVVCFVFGKRAFCFVGVMRGI